MIRFEHLTKRYPSGQHALEDVSVEIKEGEFVYVLGHSGAGKSTFLKMILREEKPTSGKIYVNGEDFTKLKKRQIPYRRRQMGMVFQDFRLIPTMNVYDNIAFAMRVIGMPHKDIKKRVEYVLNLVHLQDKRKHYPDQLSGGEQQRVAIARAVVHSPKIIIADEPTGNIDPELSYEMMELLRAINSVGITVIVVTHEHELVQRFHQRVIRLKNGKVVSDTPYAEDASSTQPLSEDTAMTLAKFVGRAKDNAEDVAVTKSLKTQKNKVEQKK